MPKAKPENCDHPWKQQERVAYGRYKCGRCDTDLTPERIFEVRHSERVMLTHGDRIAVNSQHAAGPFKGIFLWAEEGAHGRFYVLAETQIWVHEKVTREDWAAIRHVQPEYVRQAPGVRDRKQREESAA